MSHQYSFHRLHHHDHKHLPLVHLPQAEVAEAAEAAEQGRKEEEQTPLLPPVSDYAEIPQKYLWEKEKRQIVSSPNSNATT